MANWKSFWLRMGLRIRPKRHELQMKRGPDGASLHYHSTRLPSQDQILSAPTVEIANGVTDEAGAKVCADVAADPHSNHA
jgi:hypothetical protein